MYCKSNGLQVSNVGVFVLFTGYHLHYIKYREVYGLQARRAHAFGEKQS